MNNKPVMTAIQFLMMDAVCAQLTQAIFAKALLLYVLLYVAMSTSKGQKIVTMGTALL